MTKIFVYLQIEQNVASQTRIQRSNGPVPGQSIKNSQTLFFCIVLCKSECQTIFFFESHAPSFSYIIKYVIIHLDCIIRNL